MLYFFKICIKEMLKLQLLFFFSPENTHSSERSNSISKDHCNQSSNFRFQNGKVKVSLK